MQDRIVGSWPGTVHRCAVVALIAALLGAAACEGRAAPGAGTSPAGVAETVDLYAGIPQKGIVLGDPNAPLTLTEFIDLQCPYCRRFALEVLPSLIHRYVRSGQVKVVFRNLAFIGPESKKAAQMTAAVGRQDHLWQFADLLLRNQGKENGGYVTDAFLRRLAGALPGVDVRRAMKDRDDPAVAQQLEDAKREADRFGIQSTPSLLLGKTGETPHVLEISSLTPEPFARAIDALLRTK